MVKNSVKKQVVIATAIIALLAACTYPGQPQLLSTEPVAEIRTLAPDADASPTSQPDTGTLLPIALEQPFTKAAFHEGPFDFEVYLLQDPGFNRNPSSAWLYSDIPGIGTHVSWKYHGPDIDDSIHVSWGICPDILPGMMKLGLIDGDNGIREGGISLPQNIAPGSLVQFIFTLQTSQGAYGGILSFLLAQGSRDLEPSRVTIHGLHQALQASGCAAALQASFVPQNSSPDAESTIEGAPPCSAGLYVEEHELIRAPQVEPLAFVTLEGSQKDILREHQQERSEDFPDNTFVDKGYRAMWTEWENGKLIAREMWDQANDRMLVDIVFGEEAIYSIDLGVSSPVKSLQGLWTYNDHWVLEVAHVSGQNDPQDGEESAVSGQIIRDGVSLNEENGYEESFGFQLISGRPFYFFREDGQIGFSYAGQQVRLGYSQIPHYGCCSGAELNPVSAKNMVAFFARRSGKWYYVEIGAVE